MKIRRIYSLVFAAVLTLCLCACAPNVGGLKFDPPGGWTRENDQRENFAMYSSSSPKGSLAVSCNNVAESDLTDENIAKMGEGLVEEANFRGRAQIAEEGKMTLGGRLWLKISFFYPDNNERWTYYMTRFNHKQYAFLMTCPENVYAKQKPVLEKVVNSVTFAE